jgi:hypothetical protein
MRGQKLEIGDISKYIETSDCWEERTEGKRGMNIGRRTDEVRE